MSSHYWLSAADPNAVRAKIRSSLVPIEQSSCVK